MDEDDDTARACRAHGISLRPDADTDDASSDDSGRSDFDDFYQRHNPDPLPLSELEHRIVLVRPQTPRKQRRSSDRDALEHVPNAAVANKFAVLHMDDYDDDDRQEDGNDKDGSEDGDGIALSSDEETYEECVISIEDFEMMGGVREEEWQTYFGRKGRKTSDSKSVVRDVYQRLGCDTAWSSDKAPNCDNNSDSQTRLLNGLKVKTVQIGCASKKKRDDNKREERAKKCQQGVASMVKVSTATRVAEVVGTSDDDNSDVKGVAQRKTRERRKKKKKKQTTPEAAQPPEVMGEEAAGDAFFANVKTWVTILEVCTDTLVQLKGEMAQEAEEVQLNHLYNAAIMNEGKLQFLMGELDELLKDVNSIPGNRVAFSRKKPSVDKTASLLLRIKFLLEPVLQLFGKSFQGTDMQSKLRIEKKLDAACTQLQSAVSDLKLLLKNVKKNLYSYQSSKVYDRQNTMQMLDLKLAVFEREIAELTHKINTTISRKYQKRMIGLLEVKSINYLYMQGQYSALLRNEPTTPLESANAGQTTKKKKRKKNKTSESRTKHNLKPVITIDDLTQVRPDPCPVAPPGDKSELTCKPEAVPNLTNSTNRDVLEYSEKAAQVDELPGQGGMRDVFDATRERNLSDEYQFYPFGTKSKFDEVDLGTTKQPRGRARGANSAPPSPCCASYAIAPETASRLEVVQDCDSGEEALRYFDMSHCDYEPAKLVHACCGQSTASSRCRLF